MSEPEKVGEPERISDVEKAREEIIELLQAEWGYWAGLEQFTEPVWIRATMLAMGSMSNVLAGIMLKTTPAEYREAIKRRKGAE